MVHIYGVSDDLIEVEGDVRAEFSPVDDKPSYLAFSDGTVLEVIYTQLGFWQINCVVCGPSAFKKEPASDPDMNYSDHVFLGGRMYWAVFGSEFQRG